MGKRTESQRAWYAKRGREKHLEKQYGLTVEAYESMHRGQGGLCAICEQEALLYVDHCHTTGKVRGLLCSTCNSGLGQFKDNVRNLARAIFYLEGDEPPG